jgi:hypothetical protein
MRDGATGGEPDVINREINFAIVLQGEIDQIDIRLSRGDIRLKGQAINLLREIL